MAAPSNAYNQQQKSININFLITSLFKPFSLFLNSLSLAGSFFLSHTHIETWTWFSHYNQRMQSFC